MSTEILRAASGATTPTRALSVIPTARELYFSPLAEPAAQEERERLFFASIRLANGTYKTTSSRRLGDLNERILRTLPHARALELMDVAISSGISTLEWRDALDAAAVSYRMTAGDLSLHAYLFSCGDRLHALTDSRGHFLQFDLAGEAIPAPPGGRNWLRYLPPLVLLKSVVHASFASAVRGLRAAPESTWQRGGVRARRLMLVSPRLRPSDHLQLVEDDILKSDHFSAAFHVVRAANILNRAYFDDDTLGQMVSNLKRRLAPHGILAVCRTEADGANHGSVFALLPSGRFTLADRLGRGSEIEPLVLASH